MTELVTDELQRIIEAIIIASSSPVSVEQCRRLLADDFQVTSQQVREVINQIAMSYHGRAIELKEVASGYRFQVRQELSPWLQKLWQERPAKYSRALLETLALIAYKQPITRAEIEEIRGVAVSTTIIKTLTEREWVHIIGHKELPGRPALYATTKQFLDDFNLTALSQLPVLMPSQDFEEIEQTVKMQLELPIELETELSMTQEDDHE